MKNAIRVVAATALALMLFAGEAQATEITHNLALNAGETKTWNGTSRLGLNANYNGLVDDNRHCNVTNPGDFDYDPRAMCEYALVSLTNPVPAGDADGKVKKNVGILLDSFSLQSPATDVDFSVYATNANGSVKGDELGASANLDVVDPDEFVQLSIETTLAEPTKYLLVEVAYFTTLHAVDLCALPAEVRPNPCAPYKGTITF
ncbi:MAG: hypothetical protein ACRDH9_07135 [Actinomycetota bacterium]